jgi:hypothetical protein
MKTIILQKPTHREIERELKDGELLVFFLRRDGDLGGKVTKTT